MKRTTKYVALDVHQATTVASVREESGRVIARSVLPTEPAAITEFVRGMRGAVQVTFEEGTQAQWLHDLLAPQVHRRLDPGDAPAPALARIRTTTVSGGLIPASGVGAGCGALDSDGLK